jgi:hypothetical protein
MGDEGDKGNRGDRRVIVSTLRVMFLLPRGDADVNVATARRSRQSSRYASRSSSSSYAL